MLNLDDAVQVMEEAFQEYSSNPSISHPRRSLHVLNQEKRQVRLNSFLGALPIRGYIGANLRCDGFKVKGHLSSTLSRGFSILYSAEDASPLAIFYGGSIRNGTVQDLARSAICLRTAAVSALGTKYMSRVESKTLGFFGSGNHAPSHLAAVCTVRDFRKIKIYSPNRDHREKFAKEMSEILARNIVPVEQPGDVVKGSDVIMCVTNSQVPVFDGLLLEPGTHVTSIVGGYRDDVRGGKREIDDVTLRKSEVIGITSKKQAEEDCQLTVWEPSQRDVIKWKDVIELKDLIARKAQGRTSGKQITLFHNNANQGITDLAITARLYELAKENGIGRDIDDMG